MFTRKLRKVRRRKTRRGGLRNPFKGIFNKTEKEPYRLTEKDFEDIAEEIRKTLIRSNETMLYTSNKNQFSSEYLKYNPNSKIKRNEVLKRRDMREKFKRNNPRLFTDEKNRGFEIIKNYLYEYPDVKRELKKIGININSEKVQNNILAEEWIKYKLLNI
jgi:hypothetical protein